MCDDVADENTHGQAACDEHEHGPHMAFDVQAH